MWSKIFFIDEFYAELCLVFSGIGSNSIGLVVFEIKNYYYFF